MLTIQRKMLFLNILVCLDWTFEETIDAPKKMKSLELSEPESFLCKKFEKSFAKVRVTLSRNVPEGWWFSPKTFIEQNESRHSHRAQQFIHTAVGLWMLASSWNNGKSCEITFLPRGGRTRNMEQEAITTVKPLLLGLNTSPLSVSESVGHNFGLA